MQKLILRLLTTVFIAILMASFTNSHLKASADSTSPWLDTSSPLIMQKEAELPSGTTLPPTVTGYGNIDCLEHPFVTRPAQILPIPQTKISYIGCGVQTPYGIVDYNGHLELNNTSVTGSFVNPNYSGSIKAIPNSTSILNYQSTPLWGNLYLTKNVPTSLDFTLGLNGERTYKVNRPADIRLKDKAGHSLLVSLNTMSFSANGKWMVVDWPNVATLRINLETFDVLAFANSPNYDTGLDPAMKTAISSDGRYAAVSSFSNNFSLYDLSTCADVPDIAHIARGSVNCRPRDLSSFVREQIPGFRGIRNIRFIGEHTLSFYANYYATPNNPSTNKVAEFLLSAPGHTPQKLDYLAMGDSYISGEGAYNYQNGTDTDTNRCHLSLLSYPYLLSRELNFDSFHSVACSGATMDDITNTGDDYLGQADNKKIARNQRLSQEIDSIFASFSPGYINQSDFVSRYRPKVITVSISGNDIGFSHILVRCMLEPDTCYSTYEDRLELVRQINGQFPRMVNTYMQLKNQASPNTKIYVIGYPQLVQPGGDCAVNVRLNVHELDFSKLIINYLDSVIKAAADKAGVFYVDTQSALDGHKLCETNSSDVAVNGLTAGNSYPDKFGGPIGSETYHPNYLGHRLLAQNISTSTDGLSSPMPTPNNTSSLPLEDEIEILNNTPHSNRPINLVNYDNDLASDVIYRQSWWSVTVSGLKHALKPISLYRLVINSDSVDLGAYSTDTNGDLSAQFQIPSSVAAGFHTLHIYGTNLASETIDIYKIVYLAASENDWDGDGIPNSSQACIVGDASGQDYDQDGIDDACDGNIGEAPTPPPAPVVPDPEPQQPTPDPEPSAPPENPVLEDIQFTDNPQEASQPDSNSTTTNAQAVNLSNNDSPDRSALALTSSQNPNIQQANSSLNQSTKTAYLPEPDVGQPTDSQLVSSEVLASNTESASSTPQGTSKHDNHHDWFKWAGAGLAAFLIIFTLVKLPI